MSDSNPVIVDSGSPAQPAPNPPVVGDPSWVRKAVTFPVTCDPNDVNGDPTDIINIKTAFRVKGDAADFAFTDNPGTYPAGQAFPFSFTVSKYGTDYEFAFEASN